MPFMNGVSMTRNLSVFEPIASCGEVPERLENRTIFALSINVRRPTFPREVL